MPVFVYRAADQRGKTIAGVMEAPDSRAVVERLHREEYYPIEVTPQTESPGLWSRLGARRISNRDLVALTHPLATPPPPPSPRLSINMVRAGEKGGVLEAPRRRLAEFLEAAQEFREALVSGLGYPAFLVTGGG